MWLAALQRVLSFKQHLRVERYDDERVFLLGERDPTLLEGRVHALVAPLLDGRRSVQEIVAALDGAASAAEVHYSLKVLEQKGYLAERVEGADPATVTFWQSLGLDAAAAVARLSATPVAVRAFDALAADTLSRALGDAGVTVRDDADLRVVLTDDYLLPELAALNRDALVTKTPWMLVKPTGRSPWVGPILRPGEGPCWACLAHRLRANRPVEAFLQRARGGGRLDPPPRVALGPVVRAAAELAALTLARWIAGGRPAALADTLLELSAAPWRTSEHVVVRRPQCPACGDAEMLARRALAPVVLEPRQKRFTDDGGHRCLPPEDTLARLQHHVSPITGVVSGLGPAQDRDHPLRPVYGAAYFHTPVDPAPAFGDFVLPSMGKGRTAVEARTGALCEAIERHAALVQGDELLVRARLSELDGAVHPDLLQGFSARQLRDRGGGRPPTPPGSADRARANQGARESRRRVPVPFDEGASIDWAPAWSLTEKRRRYLPAAYCYGGLRVPPDEQYCTLNPSGHAAGNCREEAILHGFLELVERDAVGIWWYNRLVRPGVDLASFAEPYFLAVLEHYRSLGHALWVIDVTMDLGIPAFVALSRAEHGGRYHLGFGCHLEARLGVQRAITELHQVFDPSGRTPPPFDAAAITDPSYLAPATAAPPRRRDDFPAAIRADLRDDVEHCVACAAGAGLETIVLDQTRPDVDLAVVKVVVPGLRHFWERLGPGRLYDLPVQLGWATRPLSEDELNPVPLMA